MAKEIKTENEKDINDLLDECEAKFDKIAAVNDLTTGVLTVASIAVMAAVATPLAIGLGIASFLTFGIGGLAGKFIIEKKRTDATRKISEEYNKEFEEADKFEKILEQDRVTSEQLDLMHQFEIDNYEREMRDAYNYGDEFIKSSYMERLERRTERKMFDKYDIEK